MVRLGLLWIAFVVLLLSCFTSAQASSKAIDANNWYRALRSYRETKPTNKVEPEKHWNMMRRNDALRSSQIQDLDPEDVVWLLSHVGKRRK